MLIGIYLISNRWVTFLENKMICAIFSGW